MSAPKRSSPSFSPAVRATASCRSRLPAPTGGALRGTYRLVDFALSNLVNSGYFKIVVLTQYKSHSLDRHISDVAHVQPSCRIMWPRCRRSSASARAGTWAAPMPSTSPSTSSMMPSRTSWWWSARTTCTAWTSSRWWRTSPRAKATVAAVRQPLELANQFGVIEVDHDDPRKIAAFLEKPRHAAGSRTAPARSSRPWATTCSTRMPWSRRCPATPSDRPEARHGRGHHPLLRVPR